MERAILKYHQLTKQEQACVRIQLLEAMNHMEEEQAIDAGKHPQPYTMKSSLFKEMLALAEAERWTDEDGRPRISLLCG